MAEMPQLSSSAYTNSMVDWNGVFGASAAPGTRRVSSLGATALTPPQFYQARPIQAETEGEGLMSKDQRRLVQVFIADPDPSVPLAECLLYQGEQKMTDLTDQELFFEVDIRAVLEAHNQKRVAMVNKAVKERTENLEPARVRDLRMTVVTIAQF